jgi:hypothetical protein
MATDEDEATTERAGGEQQSEVVRKTDRRETDKVNG